MNYRGSTGFGKKFLNAGNASGAGKMHDDLLDAVQWAVDAEGRRRRTRSRSWAAATAATRRSSGLTFTPDVFRCGVDIVGPSNLMTLLATIPPYWAPMLAMFKTRIGDPDTPEGKASSSTRVAAHARGERSRSRC